MSSTLTQNYFELFGLPVEYKLDRQALDQRYRDLQRLTHPDRFASAGDQARRIAMQQAAQVNEGYRVLKDNLARGRYVLELRGHRFDDERSTHQDPAFLLEQIELREALGTLQDSTDPASELSEIMRRIDARQQALEGELALALEPAEVSESALAIVQRMQFFRKLAQEAEALEAELDDLSS